uniref:FAT atypical cadherin 4 n=1 Tax=Sander lucioperca TaxID=283035 RepID=A0A8C9XY16_SANLU
SCCWGFLCTFYQYQTSVFEDAAVGSSILQITASDQDEGANAEIRYFLDEGTPFQIDPKAGTIIIKEGLDYESKKEYSLTIHAVDNGVPSLSGRTEATIKLLDVNDNDPVVKFRYFPTTSKFASVDENAQIGTVVALLTVSDSDSPTANGNISVSILGGNEQRHFEVHTSPVPNLSLIKVASVLDRERISSYNLTVSVSDNGKPMARSSFASLVIFVNDINDHPPIFQETLYRVDISEDIPKGSYIKGVSATDGDSGQNANLRYSLVSGNALGWFSISENSGLVTSAALLDREIASEIVLNISAKDQGLQPKISYTKLIVNITDVNDQVPTFTQSTYHVSLVEHAPAGTELVVLSASDDDVGANGTIRFSFDAETPDSVQELFRLDAVSGRLSTAVELDREDQASYLLHIQAADAGIPPLHSVGKVNITLRDINDNRPVFYPVQYFANVKENEPSGAYVTTVSATDPDLGRNGTLKYIITAGDASKFLINSITGKVTTIVPLDREEKTAYQLQVTAADGSGLLQVYIQDINDNLPKFTKDIYQASISESAQNMTQLLRVSASDVDENKNGLVHYHISEGNEEGQFTIDSSSGQVTLVGKLDYESTSSYSLKIIAVDAGTVPLSSSCMLSISILDENDNSPSFPKSSLSVDVLENMRVGELVASVTATDADSGQNADITYSITATNNHGTFSISPNTGSIFLVKKMDFETQSFYKLNITAKDNGKPPRSSSIPVVIHVRDFNDNPPIFTPGDIFKSIPENLPLSASVMTITAHDTDADINGELEYSIVQQIPRGGHFSIDSSTGLIYTNKEIDREFSNLFELTIKATDQAVPVESRRFALKNVTIWVTDLNDNVPTFMSQNALVAEPNIVIGSILTTVLAFDPDEGANGEVEYELVEGDSDTFIMDRYSGDIRLASQLVQSRLMYTLTVSATDHGTSRKTSRTELTIILQGMDGPVFSQPKYITILKEGQPPGTNVISLDASSPRGSATKVEYFIVAVRSGGKAVGRLFTIGRYTGLDRERRSKYSLLVRADDGKQSSDMRLNITVKDVNDHTPKFSRATYSFDIPEDMAPGSIVAAILASDSDSGVNGEVTYSLEEDDEDETFLLNPVTGVFNVTRPLDYETQQYYILTAKARDGGGQASLVRVYFNVLDVNDNPPIFNTSVYSTSVSESLPPGSSIITVGAINDLAPPPMTRFTSAAQVSIILLDVNDCPPAFTSQRMTYIQENTPVDTVVFTAQATDADSGPNSYVEYSLKGPFGNKFSIGTIDGDVRLVGELDREELSNYTLTVVATDKGEPRLSSTMDVTMMVLDVNDNTPSFSQNIYDIEIEENTLTGTDVIQVFASDADEGTNGQIRFSISGGNTNSDFRIDSVTGAISGGPTMHLGTPVKCGSLMLQHEGKSQTD